MYKHDPQKRKVREVIKCDSGEKAPSAKDVCRYLSKAALEETKKPLADMDYELLGSCLHLRDILHHAQKMSAYGDAE